MGLSFHLGTKNFQICEGGEINVSLTSGRAGRLSGQTTHLRDIEMILCPFTPRDDGKNTHKIMGFRAGAEFIGPIVPSLPECQNCLYGLADKGHSGILKSSLRWGAYYLQGCRF